MAAETSSKSPPGTSDIGGYAPYSLLALISFGAAVLFVVLFVAFAMSAWLSGSPMEERELLLLPLIALVVGFAGRRQILNSEGTRVGLNLCHWSWWIAVLGGLGFAMYLAGVAYAVRRDAEEAFQRWSEPLLKVNPLDLRNPDFGLSFHKTLAIEKQPTVLPGDAAKMRSLLESQMLAFRQSDLVRLICRNKGNVKFEIVGLEDRRNEKSGVLACRVTVRAISPEGEHTMSLPMRRQLLKGASEPVWQIVPPQNELTLFFKSQQLNEYGECVRDLELAAMQLVYVYLLGLVNQTGFQPEVWEEFSQPGLKPQAAVDRVLSRHQARLALHGGQAWFAVDPTPGLNAALALHFIPADRGDPKREEEQRRAFSRAWRFGTVAPAGQLLAQNSDRMPLLIPGPTRWEARVPVEIQPMPPDANFSAARGIVVCVLDDPAFLQKLADLRNSPGNLGEAKPRFSPRQPVPWRVERIESDMRMIAPRVNSMEGM